MIDCNANVSGTTLLPHLFVKDDGSLRQFTLNLIVQVLMSIVLFEYESLIIINQNIVHYRFILLFHISKVSELNWISRCNQWLSRQNQ